MYSESDENTRLLHRQGLLEQEIHDQTQQLQNTIRELESFTYSVAHDLRAPLRSINNFTHALQEDFGHEFSAGAADYFDRICRASERMGRLIDDLLKLSQVGRGAPDRSPIDLSELVADSFGRLMEGDPARKAALDVEPGLVVAGDARLLAIAIDNIADNAWKFTRRRQQAEIRFFATSEPAGTRTFHLVDNGTGFDMRYRHKLFAPFQRLHHGDDFEGTGIGLVIVSRIIARHRGEVTIEGAPDRGARLSFTIPEDGR